MAEGRWADWQVRQIAQNMAEKCPKREWFDGDNENYLTSLKSWSHITTRQLYSMERRRVQHLKSVHCITNDPTNKLNFFLNTGV